MNHDLQSDRASVSGYDSHLVETETGRSTPSFTWILQTLSLARVDIETLLALKGEEDDTLQQFLCRETDEIGLKASLLTETKPFSAPSQD